jgi:hypothetical protein
MTNASDRSEARERSLGAAIRLVSAPRRAAPPPPPRNSGTFTITEAEEILDAELIDEDNARELPRYEEDDDGITAPGFAWGQPTSRVPSIAPTVASAAFAPARSQRSPLTRWVLGALALAVVGSVIGGIVSARPHPSAFLDRSMSHWSLPAVRLATQPKATEHGVSVEDLPKVAVEKDRAVEKAVTSDGRLAINSIPMSSVVLDGRPVGSTPLVGLKVSPGVHTVVFIHPEQGRRVQSVRVPAGGHAAALLRF